MSLPPSRRVTRILVINPNSSKEMTAGMATAIKELQLDDVNYYPRYRHLNRKAAIF